MSVVDATVYLTIRQAVEQISRARKAGVPERNAVLNARAFVGDVLDEVAIEDAFTQIAAAVRRKKSILQPILIAPATGKTRCLDQDEYKAIPLIGSHKCG